MIVFVAFVAFINLFASSQIVVYLDGNEECMMLVTLIGEFFSSFPTYTFNIQCTRYHDFIIFFDERFLIPRLSIHVYVSWFQILILKWRTVEGSCRYHWFVLNCMYNYYSWHQSFGVAVSQIYIHCHSRTIYSKPNSHWYK